MHDRTPAGTDGPKWAVRWRSKAELDRCRRAARLEGVSLNTFIVSRAATAAELTIERQKQQNVIVEQAQAV